MLPFLQWQGNDSVWFLKAPKPLFSIGHVIVRRLNDKDDR